MRRSGPVIATVVAAAVLTLGAACTPEQQAQLDPGTAHFVTGVGNLLTLLLFLASHGFGYVV